MAEAVFNRSGKKLTLLPPPPLRTVRESLESAEKDTEAKRKDLATKHLDLLNYENQKQKAEQDLNYKSADLNKSLHDFRNNTHIYAQEDGIITSISVNEGQYVGSNQKLLSFGRSGDLILTCNISSDNSFITVGDTCELSNATHTLEGKVVNIKPTESAKELTIVTEKEGIGAGETFDARFEKESAEVYTLIPKGALNMDNDGYYLNRIKRRDGILGKEFYAEKLRVYIGDSDNENVAIIKGIDFFDPIVLISDKPFIEGDTIKLKNESEFFE